MAKPHRPVYLTLAAVFDMVLVSAAWLLCWVIRFRIGLPSAADASTRLGGFLKVLPIILLCDLFALAVVGLYRPTGPRSIFREQMQTLKGAVFGWLWMFAPLYYYSANPYSRVMLAIFFFVNPLALMTSRALLRWTLRGLHGRGWGVRSAAIIGTGRLAQKVLHALRGDPILGVRVDYLVTEDEQTEREQVREVPVAGTASSLLSIVREHPVDTVFVAIPAGKSKELEGILADLAKLPVTVTVIPDFQGVTTLNTSVDELDGLPVVRLVDVSIQGWQAAVKRTLDIAGSLLLLAIFAIPMLVVALVVKLTSPGPVFFRQLRMGLGGKPFTILKFRTMHEGAEDESGPIWAKRDDPRCTRPGAFLRKTFLDELPQLFNVLRGDMSLVGPRPERPHFVEEFVETVPAYMLRHNVKAGMTGWAQINGLHGDTSLKKRLQYDLYYINHWSLGLDLFILFLTPMAVFRKKNVHGT